MIYDALLQELDIPAQPIEQLPPHARALVELLYEALRLRKPPSNPDARAPSDLPAPSSPPSPKKRPPARPPRRRPSQTWMDSAPLARASTSTPTTAQAGRLVMGAGRVSHDHPPQHQRLGCLAAQGPP